VVLGLLSARDVDTLGSVQGRPPRWSDVLKHLTYEERLRKLGMFSQENRKLNGDLIAVTSCVMQG